MGERLQPEAGQAARILHVVATIDPSAGGIPDAALKLSQALTATGHQSHMLTLDQADAPWLQPFSSGVFALGPNRLNYRYNSELLGWLKRRIGGYDILIAHGLWQYPTLATRLVCIRTKTPYLVYTHGQLDPWFKRNYPLKHAKKWLYWPWGVYPVLRDAAAVVFTCEQERRLARASFGLYRAKEAVVSHGTTEPPGDPESQVETFLETYGHLRGRRRLLFLSRLHEKKGCDLLIEAFARVSAGYPDVELVMAGPDQEGWRWKLESLAKLRGVADRITWTGMLTGDLKWGAYWAADAFVLPSHSENFGIVVAEALACGVPVLISNKVNIWEEVRDAGSGLIAEDDLIGTTNLLKEWLSMPDYERELMRRRARTCFEQRFEVSRAADLLTEVIRAATVDTHGTRGEGFSQTDRGRAG